MYRDNFDPEKGLIVIPDVYSNVVSSDAKFEVVTTVEAKKLVLERQDDLVGHKRMIYVINKADKTKEPIRKLTVDFFKGSLGFTDDDIIFVDKTEFDGHETRFSAETQEAMKKFARLIFEDTKQGLAKQVLNIAVCENGAGDSYFKNQSNFELTIELTDNLTLANARAYFYSLVQKIEAEDLTQITFKESNDFFTPDKEKGFVPD